MSITLKIYGNASKKVYKTLSIKKQDLKTNLMELLISKGIPIASSCNGEGVCQKCTTADGVLTCKYEVSEYLNKFKTKISISYL